MYFALQFIYTLLIMNILRKGNFLYIGINIYAYLNENEHVFNEQHKVTTQFLRI